MTVINEVHYQVTIYEKPVCEKFFAWPIYIIEVKTQ